MKWFKGCLFAIAAAVGFGLHGFLVNKAYACGVTPLQLSFFRQFLVVPIFAVIVLIRKKDCFRVGLRTLLKIFVLALLGASLTTILILFAFKTADSAVVTVLNFTYPFFVILLGRLLYKERISKRTLACLFICSAGILVICGTGGMATPLSILLALTSGLTYALYILFLDKSRVIDQVGLYPFSFWFFFLSAATLFPLALAEGTPVLQTAPEGWFWIVLLSLDGGLIATTLLQAGIALIGGTTASILGALEPVTAAVAGAVLLGEALTASKIIGIVLILISTVWIALPEKKIP